MPLQAQGLEADEATIAPTYAYPDLKSAESAEVPCLCPTGISGQVLPYIDIGTADHVRTEAED